MIRVKNRRAVALLSTKSLLANRTRNLVAIAAIALTAMLFTTLLTIASAVVNTFQEQTFRQVGGRQHAGFKSLTEEQMNELRTDSRIVSSGARLFLGVPSEPPFNKEYVEISYMEPACAESSFCTPEHGSLPAEGTLEIACDEKILELLGIQPVIGAQVPLTYELGPGSGEEMTVTTTFTLCGWWEHDDAGMASMALISRSYAEEVLAGYHPQRGVLNSNPSGLWFLNVNFKTSAHIEEDARAVLADHGYQCDDPAADNYIGIGVNWGYLSSTLDNSMDPTTALAMALLFLVILLTGYLIIYNIFQISVTNDIRFYGLLKTIGTTPRQIRRLIRRQALLLSGIGIPVGLVLGFGLGNLLAPALTAIVSASRIYLRFDPLIFVGGAFFALVTVLISCAKPGRIAGKVSPVEALRYTEVAGTGRRKVRRTAGGHPWDMAWANLSRAPKKTVLVVISLSLAVVLMQITYTFALGFDLDKYLDKWVVADFVLSDASYFQNHSDTSFTRQDIDAVNATGLVQGSGTVTIRYASVFAPESLYRDFFGDFYTEDQLNQVLQTLDRDASGRVLMDADLYGMDDYARQKLEVLSGSLDALADPTRNAIAAVYFTDDYGVPKSDSNFAQVGDTITVRYTDEWEYYDSNTGELVADPDAGDPSSIAARPKTWHDVQYEVAATVVVPTAMGRRAYGGPQFVLNDQLLAQQDFVYLLNQLIDVADENQTAMNDFLTEYTETFAPNLDFESKQSYTGAFSDMRNLFLLLGGVLSAIVAVVGILNFFNAILTSLITRRREFAVLQSIGMTGPQLKTMLIWEGISYALFAGGVSLVLSVGVGWAMYAVMNRVFWFFTYRFSLLPLLVMIPVFLILGLALPPLTYRATARQSIVERLRQSE